MNKIVLKIIICVFIFSSNIFSQNIYSSADVKLQAPFKKDWFYKSNSFILNTKMTDKVCYVNTIYGISAVSFEDGKELWNYTFQKSPTISSIVTFSEKYGTFVTYSFDDKSKKGSSGLVIIDLLTGKEKWSKTSDKFWFKPSPFLDDKNVYCIAGKPDDWEPLKDFYDLKLDDASILIYDLESGSLKRLIKLDDEKTDIIHVEQGYLFTIHDYDVSSSGESKNKLSCISIDKLEEIWEYNPSGMITKAFIGQVFIKDNLVFACPLKGSLNSISAIDLASGDEIWQKDNVAADGIFFKDDILCTFGSQAGWKLGTETSWYAFDYKKGDKLFTKVITHSMNWRSIFGKVFGSSIFGALFGLTIGLVGLAASPFISSETPTGPVFIPTRFLFCEFGNSSIYNDIGIFSVYCEDDASFFNIMKPLEQDETKLELKITPKVGDICIANGTSTTNAFISYKGKVASINISTGQQEWIKDFSEGNDVYSLGLIIHQNNMYLFTSSGITKLSSE